MINNTNNLNEGYNDAILCQNTTDYFCDNGNHTQKDDINHELIINCRYYLEGIALTPISVFGMLGRPTFKLFSNIFQDNINV